MKNLSLLKLLSLFALLVILSNRAFGQNTFIPDSNKDSVLIEQLLVSANKLQPVYKDSSGVIYGRWVGGKALYSSDNSLKAIQLVSNLGTFTTTIQFNYHGKVFEQNLSYHTDFSRNTLNCIYNLPGEKPAYLFLLSSVEDTAGYEHDWLADFKTKGLPTDTEFNHINKVEYTAVAFRFEKDSLLETTFPPIPPQEVETRDDAVATDSVAVATDTVAVENSKSHSFAVDIKHSPKSPKPLLKYDPATHRLRFLATNDKEKDNYSYNYVELAFINVESGAYEYKDTSFVLAYDTTYVYPRLDSAEVIARGNYKAGKFLIKAVTTMSYHDFTGDIFPVFTTRYVIGADTLSSYDDGANDSGGKVDPAPEYRVQSNSSLIMLLTDNTNGHGPGMCGGADYNNSYFWLIDKDKHPQQLFSYTYGSCNSDITYAYTRNGKDVEGKFYLTHSSDSYMGFEKEYWKNRSTYVFVMHDEQKNLSRNYYLHFDVLNKKVPVTLKPGKLYKPKQRKTQ